MTKSPSQSPKSPPSAPATAFSGMAAHVDHRWRDIDDDINLFINTVSAAKSKSRPDVLAAVLTHYASKWLPYLTPSPSTSSSTATVAGAAAASAVRPPDSPTTTWLKKRLLVETLAAALPPEDHHAGSGDDGGLTCGLLLRLLRAGSMIGADAALLKDLEARAARRLEQAALAELMIPAFSHTSGTLLNVGLVLRLVRGFVTARGAETSAATRVARLVDAYLAEVALEPELGAAEFEELAFAVPAHARSVDDGLYRAVDTYLKTHPSVSKEERKSLCRLIDPRKLSSEGSAHAIQNDRLPVRSVMQILFSENAKLYKKTEWSGSFNGTGGRSPNPAGTDLPGRCPSKREVMAQQQELWRLREDVARLQLQCHALQAQVDRLSLEKKNRKGFFRWSSFLFGASGDVARVDDSECGAAGRNTPANSGKERSAAGGAAVTKWRKSTS